MALLLQTLLLAVANIRLRYHERRTRPHYDYVEHVVTRIGELSHDR